MSEYAFDFRRTLERFEDLNQIWNISFKVDFSYLVDM